MSDYDESFDDSFESESDSDHADGVALEDQYLHNVRGVHIPITLVGGGGSLGPGLGGGVETAASRKERLLLQGGNGAKDSLSDPDDWR